MNSIISKITSFFKQKLNDFAIGLKMMKISFSVILHDKKIIIVPLITSIIGTAFFALYSFLILTAMNKHKGAITFPLFSFILISYLFFLFFVNSILCAFNNISVCVYFSNAFDKNPIGIGKSIRESLKNITIVIKWAIVDAAINVILVLLKGKDKNNQTTGFFGTILGVSWKVATLFVVPIMAFEKIGIFATIKQSMSLVKNTFGQSVTGMVGFGFLGHIILSLPAIIFILLGKHENNVDLVITLSIIAFYFLITLPIWSTAKTIFKTAIYNFAVGKATGPFEENDIQASFKK